MDGCNHSTWGTLLEIEDNGADEVEFNSEDLKTAGGGSDIISSDMW